MDHVPLPRHPSRMLNLEVPCLSTERYDGGDYASYPERQGWGGVRGVQEWHRIFSNPSKDFQAFFQRWLFFGLLEVVFGEPVNPEDFSRIVNGGSTQQSYRVLSTRPLVQKYQRLYWAHQTRRQELWDSQPLIKARFAVTLSTQLQSRLMSNLPLEEDRGDWELRACSLVAFITSGICPDPRDPRIAMAENILCQELFALLYLSFRPEEFMKVFCSSYATPTSAMYRRLRELGWCPSDISVLLGRLNDSCLYYISHLDRPDPAHHHKMVRVHGGNATAAPETSELCSASACALRVYSDDTYKTQHADGCSRDECYEMVADRDEAADILKSGSWPLVMSIDEEDDSRALSLVPFSPGSDISYVAISHVWSDGLGNVERTALPRCQMLRLSRAIRNLPGRAADMLLFWIDTIGCPPDAAHQDEVQNLAISMMRQTYEDATAVLVLDSWLMQKRIERMDDTEILLRIACSNWNGRLWTLQEGVLARNLIFKFADAMYDLDDGTARFRQTTLNICHEISLKPVILQRLQEFRGFKTTTGGDQANMILAISNALRFRATSVATDEPICLAALMDLDVGEIVRTAPSERMPKLWGMLREFPASFLLIPLPRLEEHGYGWAPQTFLLRGVPTDVGKDSGVRMSMGTPGMPSLGHGGMIEIRPEGLHLRRSGYVFRIGSRSVGELVYICDDKGIWWQAELHLGRSNFSYQHQAGRHLRFHPKDISGTEEVAVMHFAPSEVSTAVMRASGLQLAEFANFLCVLGEVDGVIYARRVCSALLRKMPEPPGELFSTQSHPTMGAIELLPAVSRTGNQPWCLV